MPGGSWAEDFREQFPVSREYAYFQSPGVTALPEPTRQAVCDFASQMEQHGCVPETEWVARTKQTRVRIGKLLKIQPERIGFVPNTSSGLSLVAEGLSWESGDRVAVPEGEFPSNLFPWLNQRHRSVTVDRIPLDEEGKITPERIEKTLTETTKVLAISSVQFHNGFKMPLKFLDEFQNPDRYVVVDGIQSVGWDDLDLDSAPVDALVADAHKWLCGPEGIGLMYVSQRLQDRLRPVLVGWKSVKNAFEFTEEFELRSDTARFEPGSSNHLGIYALGESVKLLNELPQPELKRYCLGLAERARDELSKRGFEPIGSNWPEKNHSPIVSVRPPEGVDSKVLAEKLAELNIVVAARRGTVRAGFHGYNNPSDLQQWMDGLDQLL